jgi:TolB-like protein/DNA-binding winged helix-turn-helix (wHTH) protein
VTASPHPPIRVSTDTNGGILFGTFRLDVHSRELREGGSTRRLTAQPFEILRLLLERPGDVITRHELQRRLWPDGTFVDFDHSLNSAVRRLRTALGDNAGTPRFVETLPGHGYRFRGEGPPRTATRLPSRPRLAVLPLTNLGDRPTDEQFVDGLTEEVVAQLGLQAASTYDLVASGAVFKRTMQRLRDAGTVLKADYIVEGSVRCHGDSIRIVVRLAHASSETQRWADTYDRRRSDPLALHHDVAVRVAASVASTLSRDVPPSPVTVASAPPERDEVPHVPPRVASHAWRRAAMVLATIITWALLLWTVYSVLRPADAPRGGDDSRKPWYADSCWTPGLPHLESLAAASAAQGMSPAHLAHDSVRCMPVTKSIAGL